MIVIPVCNILKVSLEFFFIVDILASFFEIHDELTRSLKCYRIYGRLGINF